MTEHTEEDENAFCVYISGLRRRKHKTGTLKEEEKRRKEEEK
jgi:hypothetical protein